MWFQKFESGVYHEHRTPSGTRSEVEVLYNEDPSQTQQEIADSLGVSKRMVWSYLKALRENGQIERQVKSVTTRTQVEELYDADPFQTQREIADTLGCSETTVWRHLEVIKKNREKKPQVINCRSEVGALYDAGPSGTQQIVNKHGMSGSTVSTVSTVSYHVKAIEEETGRQVSGTTSQLEALPDTTPHQTPPVLTENFGISEATAWYHVKAIEENREKETQVMKRSI
ncbi:uncharacterized protein LOC105274772 [Ooceraea biroi]|uniref:uncharacterized protein LOC105274772 n=1 Tax=Ooceraea biroi TaxID=2015173 RepID=UPI000F085963|nr:uncharacterized protein LOC105274772 [Ooceraea biroi]